MRTRRRTLSGALLAVVATAAALVLSATPAAADPPANAYGPAWYTCIDNWDGREECFWVGTTTQWGVPGTLWHRWEVTPGGGWSGAHSMGGYLDQPLNVARNADGRVEVFGRGSGKVLMHIWQKSPNGSTGWSSWQSLGGGLESGPFLSYRTGGAIRVDIIGLDYQWYYRYQVRPSCCWTTNWYAG